MVTLFQGPERQSLQYWLLTLDPRVHSITKHPDILTPDASLSLTLTYDLDTRWCKVIAHLNRADCDLFSLSG